MPAYAPGSPSSLHTANQRRVLRAVRDAGRCTQADIARRTGLAPSTVSNLVHELIREDVLAMEAEHAGRRGQLVGFSETAGLVAGIDVGHRHLTTALAGQDRTVVARRRHELPAGHDARSGLELARRDIDAMLEQTRRPRSGVLAAGLTLPAPVDRTGTIVTESILPGWGGPELPRLAREILQLPLVVENDANAGALSEHAVGTGASRRPGRRAEPRLGPHDSMAYLKIGHGVGAGLILDGRLHRGATGIAGELGHVTIDEHGSICRCGNRGCLETLVSSTASTALLAGTRGPDLSIQELVRLGLDGDAGCRRVIADVGRALGRPVADLFNTLDPHLVVIGGEISEAGELLLEPLRRAVERYVVGGAQRRTRIVASDLGREAHVLGAVLAALQHEDLLLEDARHPS